MKKETMRKTMTLMSLFFAIIGIIFLCISIFSEVKDNTYLCIALGGIVISNILNVARHYVGGKHKL